MKLSCDLCGKIWEDIDINPDEDVWSVFQSILSSHRKQSPKCDGNRWTIKILEVK